jgi:XTP/dITP diphosphohydrolase
LKRIVIASKNKGKIRELNALLNEYGHEAQSMEQVGISDDIVEDGDSLMSNALIKANYLFEKLGTAVMADDSGLFIDALYGQPGIHSARFAGSGRSDSDNIDKVLDLMKDHSNRKAHFAAVICHIADKGLTHFYEGRVHGTITHERIGIGGFGYDPIFIPDGYTDTFAVLSDEIKNKISHRAEAMRRMVEALGGQWFYIENNDCIQKKMTNKVAKEFINNVFDHIVKSENIETLNSILDNEDLLKRNNVGFEIYPKLEFEISVEDIKSLISSGVIDQTNHNLNLNISSGLKDPLTKLLYAIIWKNGDLKKIKHIINGILESEDTEKNQDGAVVFYQFGKHLANSQSNPIIDQHVIRAFSIYKVNNLEEVESFRKLNLLDKKHTNIISEYKDWIMQGKNISSHLKLQKDYTYYIDKILFAAGKAVKIQK